MEKGRYAPLNGDEEETCHSKGIRDERRVDWRRLMFNMLPHVISIITIAVCGSLVAWKYVTKVTTQDVLDPQAFFPECR